MSERPNGQSFFFIKIIIIIYIGTFMSKRPEGEGEGEGATKSRRDGVPLSVFGKIY